MSDLKCPVEKCLNLFQFYCLGSISILKVIEIFEYLLTKKYLVSHLNISHGKMSNFVSFPLFELNSGMKLGNFDYKSHWSTSICCDKKDILSDLNMSHGKMSNAVSFSLFPFTLVIKLKTFYFESHVNTLILFDKKMMSDLFMSCQRVSDLV